MRPSLLIGTSGWSYPAWRDGFYLGVPQRRWLEHYSRIFPAVEVNASFYREVRPSTCRAWAELTPPRFRFALKAHRLMTHTLRLDFPPEPLLRQRDAAQTLGDKLAAVLWQAPASLRWDADLLARFLARLALWPGTRHALELRHPSWFNSAAEQLLARHGVAACQSDAADWPLWDAVTADLVYLRLHGHARTYVSRYGKADLARWARRIRTWLRQGRTVHAYFDNSDGGAAPVNAAELLALLEEN